MTKVLEQVVGFVVLRMPQLAVASTSDSSLAASSYRGVDREPWCDLSVAYHAGTLSPSLKAIYRKLLKENRDLTGIRITKHLDDAAIILDYFRQEVEHNELFVIFFSFFQAIKGHVECSRSIQWLGYDAFCIGQWSLLKNGYFISPSHFTDLMLDINEHGLLASADNLERLTRRYVELTREEIVEDLGSIQPHVEAIRVGKLSEKSGTVSTVECAATKQT